MGPDVMLEGGGGGTGNTILFSGYLCGPSAAGSDAEEERRRVNPRTNALVKLPCVAMKLGFADKGGSGLSRWRALDIRGGTAEARRAPLRGSSPALSAEVGSGFLGFMVSSAWVTCSLVCVCHTASSALERRRMEGLRAIFSCARL